MTVRWNIDHATKRLDVTTEGDVTRAECEAFLDAAVKENVMPYRKLFDATAGEASMGLYDILALCARIRTYHGHPTGPLAIVMPENKSYPFVRVLGALAAARRPLRIFRELKPAQRWLDTMTPSVDGVSRAQHSESSKDPSLPPD